MQSLFAPILTLHIAAGMTAVAVGLVPLLTRKGARLHRLSGRLFAGVMGVLLVAAWTLTLLRFNAYFAGLTAAATLQVFSGVRALRRKRPDINPADRAKAIDWLVALTAIGAGLWVWAALRAGPASPTDAIAWSLVWATLTFGAYDLWRFARPAAFPAFADLWFYEHLVKMLGAYGAVMSAFAGNFLAFGPSPWRQLWPTILFETLTVLLIVVYAIRRRRPAIA
ncbi:putative membrane protein [Caulobacter ginsengisoli]|uniref:Membrane protein n=1 Tax=Caulobacter ginsengisoli TaxID=400775 RepID=A0ABU0IWT6_9CAUL|nr:hypothetical protein [Caulobacter ginsengisoli]MDQ0465494.1 putative membrane protein [Caulobacter ginsengisoli]